MFRRKRLRWYGTTSNESIYEVSNQGYNMDQFNSNTLNHHRLHTFKKNIGSILNQKLFKLCWNFFELFSGSKLSKLIIFGPSKFKFDQRIRIKWTNSTSISKFEFEIFCQILNLDDFFSKFVQAYLSHFWLHPIWPFWNYLPEIKWFGHLANFGLFWMLMKIVYFKAYFGQIWEIFLHFFWKS